MSFDTENQPDGTPTWIDLGIPDLEGAMRFYGALFGWDFQVGPPETMRYTHCLLGGRRVAALAENRGQQADGVWWNMYLATGDCDATVRRVTDAGGTLVMGPVDVPDQGRMAIAKDPVGAQFGLWEGRGFVGCEVVNEPGSLVRNDLVTSDPEPARAFYSAVFGFTLDGNQDMPGFDFTFLRRPDGHEIGGVMGSPGAPSSSWATTFEVADTDAVVARAAEAGGSPGAAEDFVYGRMATITDPFGAEFTVIARPEAQRG
ncbi:MAG TPA: VOC family protein [Actinomycetota bacterium]|nr:VOC family protein [Actinomycetota bacterium]